MLWDLPTLGVCWTNANPDTNCSVDQSRSMENMKIQRGGKDQQSSNKKPPKNQSKSRDKKQLTSALRDCFPKLAPGAVQNSRWEHQKTCSQCLGLSPSPPSSKSRWVHKPGNYTKPFCFGVSYEKESFKTCTNWKMFYFTASPQDLQLCSPNSYCQGSEASHTSVQKHHSAPLKFNTKSVTAF